MTTDRDDGELEVARRVLRTEAEACSVWWTGSTSGSCAPSAARRLPRPVILTGMGKSGLICRKIRRDAREHGHAGFFLHPPRPSTATSASSSPRTWSSPSRTAARPRNCCAARNPPRLGACLVAITGNTSSTLAEWATSPSTRGWQRKPAR